MSEIMLGVLRMPDDLFWNDCPITRQQHNAIRREAAEEITRLRSLLDDQRLILEALCEGTDGSTPALVQLARKDTEIDRLRARLAEIEGQKPDYYARKEEGVDIVSRHGRAMITLATEPDKYMCIPLYAAPVPAQPHGCPVKTHPIDQVNSWADDYAQEGEPLIAEMLRAYSSLLAGTGGDRNPEYGDAYQGAREDLEDWKRRALRAENALRKRERQAPMPAIPEGVMSELMSKRDLANRLNEDRRLDAASYCSEIAMSLDAVINMLAAAPQPEGEKS